MSHGNHYALNDAEWAKAIIMHLTGQPDLPTPLLLKMVKDIRTGHNPRRNDLCRMTGPELAIRECVLTVEKLGAHALLTEAVVALEAARNKVADYIDLMHPDGR